MKKTLILLAASAALAFGGEQFSMSDADRAMYAEMLESNPAEMFVAGGADLLEEHCGGDAGLAKFLDVSEEKLPEYIAGFPRYVKKLEGVVALDQVLQALMAQNKQKPFALKSAEMFAMSAYAKSIANDVEINIDVTANAPMKKAYALGKEVYETKRGGRGLACLSCHSSDVIGSILRTQPLPDLGDAESNSGGTWPAYRMTKSSLTTIQKRFQGCMQNALLAVIPLGSEEMVALEVYITNLGKGNAIAIPGLKR
ncbi:MAG: sulfur oxidation c-type cytochrome SoxA [Campylobacterales bacterium]|nr:sulfur oxidation c-type cytochrome SoxA [Campylobacterales bacterium]